LQYWTILGFFKDIKSNLIEFENSKIEKLSIHSKEEANNILNILRPLTYKVENIEIKKRQTKAPDGIKTSIEPEKKLFPQGFPLLNFSLRG
jgi:DNA topoisomerase-1